ncbi:aldose 1-epimerase family protein [Yimella sp. cx-573]|nr:aldose 1-epimerase family protein [Yimella sp. cx-573]
MVNERAASGQQWTLSAHGQELVVVESGGGIRTYRVDGQDVVSGFGADAKADAGRGQHLFPWPNRIRDGKYTFAGKEQQLALTEPARQNASHGLTRWSTWHVIEQSEARLVVAHSLLPQQGWDGLLDLTVTYELTPDGLTVRPGATNVGAAAVPFGYGAHPYLTAGEQAVDDLTLSLPVDTLIEVDDRLIPTGQAALPQEFDFRQARQIEATKFDHAFTDLGSEGGRWSVHVEQSGRSTRLWADAETFPYVQVFTGDSLPGDKNRRSGVAVEPMTCPANAFVTGEGLLVLEPGQQWSGQWGITAQIGERGE